MTGLTDHKIVIAGGGPAGAATAIALAQRGIHSILLDASPAGQKVGETLSPHVLPVLKALQADHLLSDPVHLPCYGNLYNWGDETVQEKHFLFTPGSHGWHLDRSVFEQSLLEVARQKGVTVIDYCRIRKAEKEESGWKLTVLQNGKEEEVMKAAFIADATGRNALIARSQGVQRLVYDELIGIATRFRISDVTALQRFTRIQAVEKGWWYTALGSSEIITVYMTQAHLADKHIRELPGYWNLLEQASLIHSLFPAGYTPVATKLSVRSAATGRLEEVYGDGWLAVGDAAYSYDPVSSYGITSALGGGYYAGQAIADHLAGSSEALPAYRHVTEKAFAAYLPMWEQQYQRELRWTASSFWSKWQQKVVA